MIGRRRSAVQRQPSAAAAAAAAVAATALFAVIYPNVLYSRHWVQVSSCSRCERVLCFARRAISVCTWIDLVSADLTRVHAYRDKMAYHVFVCTK